MVKRSFAAGAGVVVLFSHIGALQLQGQVVDPDSVVPLSPVSVTVLRTPLRMDEVPYAVSVNGFPEIQLGKPGISVEEALRVIPGVQVDNRFNPALGERVVIRGFGARSQFGVRGVRVLVDGIPATLPDGQSSLTHVDVKSLGRVEVVRGPAASLYGNTAGGVIQMETQVASPHPLTQEFSAVFGSYGMNRLQSTTSGRADAVHYQLNFTRLATDGYRQHSDARNLFLNGRMGYDGAQNRFRMMFSVGDTDARNPGSLTAAQQEEERFQAFANNIRFQTGKTVAEGLVGASWLHTGAPGELELAGYGMKRDVVNPIPFNIIDLRRVGGGGRALFRSNRFGAAGFHFAIGAEADRQSDDRLEFANNDGVRGNLRIDQLEQVDNIGVFGQIGIHPARGLTLLGGLRYDRFNFSVDDAIAAGGDASGDRDLDAISPSIGAVFAFTEDVHLYGNIGQTFETPTTVELGNRQDARGGLNPDLEPQEATSFEIGFRTLLAQRLSLQVAAYHSDVENSLVPFEVEGEAGVTYFRNAGSATHRGFEIGAALTPVDGLSIRSAYSLTSAKFDDYTVGDQSYSGNKVPGVAPNRLETVVTVSPQGVPWYVAAENRFVARTAANDLNAAFSPSYTITELRGGLDSIDIGRTSVDLFGGISNIFDKDYNTSLAVNAVGGRFFEAGPGRSFYFGGNVRLNSR